MAQKGGPCYRGQARLSTTSQALRASSPSRGASGETVHFAETAKASPTRRGGIASAMTERLYEDRADGSRAVSTKKEDPLSELQLREGGFFRFGESNELHCFYLLYFYYMPFPAKVKRCAESLQAHHQARTMTTRQYSRPATVLWQTPTHSLVLTVGDTSL